MNHRFLLSSAALVLGLSNFSHGFDKIHEYPLRAGAHPFGISLGFDGAMWFTEAGLDKVGRITTSGSTSIYSIPGAATFKEPKNICFASGTSLAFTGFNRVDMISTEGVVTDGVPLGAHPYGICPGPDNTLWFTAASNQGGFIGYIDGQILGSVASQSGLKAPGGIVYHVQDDAFWFTDSRLNCIERMTQAGDLTSYKIPTRNSLPDQIAVGPDGNLWFTERAGNKIGRVTTLGEFTEFKIPTPHSTPRGIAAATDGNLWFTEQTGDKVGCITTDGVIRELKLAPGSAPVGIAAGVDSLVWFTEFGTNKIGRVFQVEPEFAVSTDGDGVTPTQVHVFGDGSVLKLTPFSGYTGGVRVALGDVNNDGFADIICATGPGGGPHVKVFDGETGKVLQSFFAFETSFKGGVFVAAGDVNGDGYDDIIVGQGKGGSHVKVFSGIDGSTLHDFLAFDPAFTGGVTVAAGDVDNDGYGDVIVGAGPGGSPQVLVQSGSSGSTLMNFLAYPADFTGGVYVSAGDVNGDGNADIITGPGRGSGPSVQVFSGADGSSISSFLAFDRSFTGGVRVAATDYNGDDHADIIVAAGPGGGPKVTIFSGTDSQGLSTSTPFGTARRGGLELSGSFLPVTK